MVKYVLEGVKKVFQEALEKVVRSKYPSFRGKIEVNYPKNRNLGDIATNVAFQVAYSVMKEKGEAKRTVNNFANEIVRELKNLTIPYISEIRVVNGYINGYLKYHSFARDVIKNILTLKERYGSRERKGKKIIVEHTSANPIHPLHIGTARNSVLGDSIARIYRFIGYEVETRFYVNDVGKQVAYLVYAYSRIRNKVSISGKPDHWFGSLYSLANVIIEITKGLRKIELLKNELITKISKMKDQIRLRRKELSKLVLKLTRLKEYNTLDWITILRSITFTIKKEKISNELNTEIIGIANRLYTTLETTSEWLKILTELVLRWPELSSIVLHELINSEDIEEKISTLMKSYERGDHEEINNIFHEVCNLVLEGIKETLSRIYIKFNKFDWESELVRSGLVTDIINKLVDNGWVIEDEKGAKILNIKEACKLDEVRRIFEIKEFKENSTPPNLVLVRSDGTTLYTTRDIAYAVLKGMDHSVEKVLNVIGKDQELPQKQLKAALYLAGYKNIAEKIIHVSYELVTLPGEKLSSRRGRYITFDELLDEAIERAREEIRKRQRGLSKEEEESIARAVAIGAVKYALISVAPEKIITFNWGKVLNFEQNSGPFLQYSYARASSILRKIDYNLPDPNEVKYDALDTEVEKELIFNLSRFPEIVLESSKKARPDIIADYANKTAIIFNSFYQRYPVLKADTEDKKKARILLVEAFRIVLKNAMYLLGITSLEKM